MFKIETTSKVSVEYISRINLSRFFGRSRQINLKKLKIDQKERRRTKKKPFHFLHYFLHLNFNICQGLSKYAVIEQNFH